MQRRPRQKWIRCPNLLCRWVKSLKVVIYELDKNGRRRNRKPRIKDHWRSLLDPQVCNTGTGGMVLVLVGQILHCTLGPSNITFQVCQLGASQLGTSEKDLKTTLLEHEWTILNWLSSTNSGEGYFCSYLYSWHIARDVKRLRNRDWKINIMC